MDQNFFFKWVWRFNALALALVLLAGAVVAVPLLSWRLAPVIPAVVPPTGEPEKTQYQWTMQSPREGQTHGMLALEIPAPRYTPGGSFSSEAPPYARVVNYLFVDTATGATRWLLPTNNQVITATDYVTETMPLEPGYPARGPALAIVFDVAPGDPAAFLLRNSPKYQVYASKPDGTGLTKLLDDLDEAPVFVPLGREQMFFRARANGKPFAATFGLADFKLISRTDLSELTPK